MKYAKIYETFKIVYLLQTLWSIYYNVKKYNYIRISIKKVKKDTC